MSGHGLRPEVDSATHSGYRIEVVDGAGILAAASVAEVAVRHDGAFPPPVRRVDLAVSTAVDDGGARVHVLTARIRIDRKWRPAPVLGRDPIGLLLASRVAAGDPWALRLVDVAGSAIDRARDRFGPPGPRGPAQRPARDAGRKPVLEDGSTALRPTVSERAEGTILRAVVPSDTVTPAHLRAMFGLALTVVADAVAPDVLTVRHYVLGRETRGARPAEGSTGVSLDQVGGLPGVVAQFRDIAISFQHPEVMARWGARRPQGILLYGPPGTGKTMLARALATEIDADFREIRTPEILDKWLGASERNIKRVFRQARGYRRPTVMLFDEFDSIISYAGGGDDAASQAVNAVAGIFKQEMNNLIEENPNVIVVATTNFPDRVDDSLIRSGRFDVKLAIPLPDAAGRAEILATMIRRLIAEHEVPGFRMFADDVDPVVLANSSAGMTGADLGELLRRATMDKAMQEARSGSRVDPISQRDLVSGIADLRRSGVG